MKLRVTVDNRGGAVTAKAGSRGDARVKMDEIIAIYKGMGRPVPELGNEQ